MLSFLSNVNQSFLSGDIAGGSWSCRIICMQTSWRFCVQYLPSRYGV